MIRAVAVDSLVPVDVVAASPPLDGCHACAHCKNEIARAHESLCLMSFYIVQISPDSRHRHLFE